MFGAGEESRTLDLYLGKVSLYQLSYSRKTFWRREPESNRPTRICNPVHNRFAIAPHHILIPNKNAIFLFLKFVGAGEESRTLDLYLGKVSLYQLSYSRNEAHIVEVFLNLSMLLQINAFQLNPGTLYVITH